jgi:hypothetical protein
MSTRASTLEVDSEETTRLRGLYADLEIAVQDLQTRVDELQCERVALLSERDALLARTQEHLDTGLLFPLELPQAPTMHPEDIAYIESHGMTLWQRRICPGPLPIDEDGPAKTTADTMAKTITIELEDLLGAQIDTIQFRESCGRVSCFTLKQRTDVRTPYGPLPAKVDVLQLLISLNRQHTALMHSYYTMVSTYWQGRYTELYASNADLWPQLRRIAYTIAPYTLLPSEFVYLIGRFRDLHHDISTASRRAVLRK